jgi:N-acetylneuraminate synthase
MSTFSINGHLIGPGHPTYIIAELSANHRQDFQQAVQLVEVAKQAGADATKLQTYNPDTITIRCDSPEFVHGNESSWAGRSLYDLYAEAYMPWEWQPELKRIANGLGMDCFSTAFDPTAVDFLESLDVPVHKIASFEIVDIPLIQKIAATGKPLIISTGMAKLAEVEEAVAAAREAGARQIALLKCTSAYPAPPCEMHLRTIPHMSELFHVPVGLSDHTLGIAAPVAAVALGACIVEKHFTLSRSVGGPDSAFSLEPDELKAMVEAIRVAEQALGIVHYGPNPQEAGSRKLRRSLFVVQNMRAGERFTPENLRSIRPGYGLHPRHLDDFIGRAASRDIVAGSPLAWTHLASNY